MHTIYYICIHLAMEMTIRVCLIRIICIGGKTFGRN